MQKEIFITNNDNSFEKIENDLIKIIQDNPTPTILKLENKIQKLEDDNELKKMELNNENLRIQLDIEKEKNERRKLDIQRYIAHKRSKFEELILHFIMKFYEMNIRNMTI